MQGMTGCGPCRCDAATLIQRFGSAAKLSIHLPCGVLEGVYRHVRDGVTACAEASATNGRRTARDAAVRHHRAHEDAHARGLRVEGMGWTRSTRPSAMTTARRRALRPQQASSFALTLKLQPAIRSTGRST